MTDSRLAPVLAICLAVANAFQPPARVDRFGDPLPEGVIARLGTARLRHGNGMTLAFAPDGKTLLTFGGDRTFRTWDLSSGRLLKEQPLPVRASYTPVAVLSSDGRFLAFQDDTSWDTILLWDVVRNRLRHKIPRGQVGWHRAAFSPDGATLVTGRTDGTLRAWDVATGQSRRLGSHKRELHDLFFSADGSLLSRSMTPDDTVRLWDVKAGRERSQVAVPEDTGGATLSPDGRVVASWRYSRDGVFLQMQFWDAATGRPVKGWTSPELKKVHAVRFAPDGKALLIGTADGILVWDPAAGKTVRTLPGGNGLNLTFSPDGKTAATLGGSDGHTPYAPVVRIWDLATGAPHRANATEHGHPDEVDGVAFAPDGKTVASACRREASVRLWAAATGRPLRTLSVKEELIAHALTFSADGKQIFIGTRPAVLRFDVATGREDGRFPLAATGAERYGLMVLQLADDGRSLHALSYQVGKGQQYAAHSWDVISGKQVRTVAVAPRVATPAYYRIASSRFSGDGRLLVLPGEGIIEAATGKGWLPLSAPRPEWLDHPAAFSADGALAAVSVWQQFKRGASTSREPVAVQVWEVPTGLPVVRLEAGALAHLAFTPDGRRLLSADRDALRLWDLASGKELARRPAPSRGYGSFGPSFVSALALAADGRTVATGQPDGTVLIWDLSPAPRQPAAPLTAKERQALWADLAGDDAGRACQAIARLADAPEQVMPLLRERLRPAQKPPAEEVRRLIDLFDSPRFEARDAATKRLAELGEGAHAVLREAMREQPSLEVRRRIEPLLDRPALVREPEARRSLRAVCALERIGSDEARRVLETLARGADGMRLTEEARAALRRLGRPR